MSLISQRLVSGTPEYENTRKLYYKEFPDTTVELDFDYLFTVLEKISADFYYYTYDGEYAGFTISIPGKIGVYYYMIAVSPNMRSKGIGSQIAYLLKDKYPGKILAGIVEADDVSPEGMRIMERRLAFHAKIGLKKTEYRVRDHTRNFIVLSTADTFNPEDFKDIIMVMAETSKEMVDQVSLYHI